MSSFRAWESWAIYPSDFLIKLQNIFLGLVRQKPSTEIDTKKSTFDDDIDGKPINLESSDNRPLALVADYDDEEDIDGKPISNIAHDIDGRPLHTTQESRPCFHEEVESNSSSTVKPRFVPTKWQSIDPNQVAAQAVTISKWDFDQESTVKGTESLYEDLAETSQTSSDNHHINNDEYIRNNSSTNTHSTDNTVMQDSLLTSDMSEERRQKLREIEIQVLKYTDELESGRREPSYGLSLAEEIEIYRQNLLKKIEDDDKSTGNTSSSISTKHSNDLSRSNSSRYSQQRSIDEKST
jgi:U2-associated protein SR140